MTVVAPIRVHQQTTTTGTGTYSLNAVSSYLRAFNAAYATGANVPYVATDNNGNYEMGIGTLTTGSPDTIARTNVFLSSNSNAAVSWSAGTRDIFAFEAASTAYPINFTSNTTITASDSGNVYFYTGTAAASFTLPLLSAVYKGFTTMVCNMSNQIVTITLSGSDAFAGSQYLATLTLAPGDSAEISALPGTGWIVDDNSNSTGNTVFKATAFGGM